ncbi:hypothetical protein [Paenibacillus xanthanilyticus]|uniref:Spore coat protein n=1 Tax=Paenibacillus xanthanilyticus TaxID=1783531 RepID=A0ABV8K2T7_9BACL
MDFALHETLEVHELAAFKTICLTTAKTMRGLVSDPQLKDILQQDVETTHVQLQELGTLLTKAIQ